MSRCDSGSSAVPVFLLCLFLLGGPACAQWKIEFSDTLTGGDFYRTVTTGEAQYWAFVGGQGKHLVVPSSDADFGVLPTTLDSSEHPVRGRDGRTGSLVIRTGYWAGEGSIPDFNPFNYTEGRGRQSLNIGGTFRIVPDPGTPGTEMVGLLAKGIIDGFIDVRPIAFAGPPTASFNASFFIEGLGTITASSSSSGTETATVGAEATVSKEPGIAGSAEHSSQVTTSGNAPQNFYVLGKVPVQTDIRWNVTVEMTAMNTSRIGNCSVASSVLTEMFCLLTPQPLGALEDPFYSDSVFHFDAGTGALTVSHPLAHVGQVERLAAIENGVEEQRPPVDYAGLKPSVEMVLDNGQFVSLDVLRGTLIRYSGLARSGVNPDGTISFTDGTLEFLDPYDGIQTLARAQLRGVVADPAARVFTARMADVENLGWPAGESPLIDALVARGGRIYLDPGIITATSGFTQTASTEVPYSVVGLPHDAFTLADALLALRSASGMHAASRDDFRRLDVEVTGRSAGVLDAHDALRVARLALDVE